ncbi:hypothetical protein J4449_02965 [Candidatus Woesearchaeota archaeon]|nr:hypothetical protein [Candidatus Woesearchaeota archaeon]
MEPFEMQIEEAKKALKTADHLAYITYPLVADNKLMLLIAENLYNSIIKTICALLNYDRYYKRIPVVPEDSDEKIILFKTEICKRYNIDTDIILMIKDIKAIAESRKNSNMELFRKKELVIITEDFSRAKTLSLKKVKDYINTAKILVNKADSILKNARRF